MSPAARTPGPGPNPDGMCRCGCGGTADLAPRSSSRTGNVRGTPMRYARGHAARANRAHPIAAYRAAAQGKSTRADLPKILQEWEHFGDMLGMSTTQFAKLFGLTPEGLAKMLFAYRNQAKVRSYHVAFAREHPDSKLCPIVD